MSHRKVWTAEELELLSPDERARVVREGMLASPDDLDPDFRARVEAKSRRVAEQHGVVNTEPS